MIFSATGRVAFARVSVVVIRPCSKRLVTRLRKVARRCEGLRPSFDPELRCRIVVPYRFVRSAAPGSKRESFFAAEARTFWLRPGTLEPLEPNLARPRAR